MIPVNRSPRQQTEGQLEGQAYCRIYSCCSEVLCTVADRTTVPILMRAMKESLSCPSLTSGRDDQMHPTAPLLDLPKPQVSIIGMKALKI